MDDVGLYNKGTQPYIITSPHNYTSLNGLVIFQSVTMVTKCKINVQYYPSKTRDKCQYKCSHKLKVIFSARNGIRPMTTFLKFLLYRLVEEEI